MNGARNNDQRGSETTMAGRPPDAMTNPQPPPNTTLSMSMSFPGVGPAGLGGDQGPSQAIHGGPTPPQPRCQLVNPFLAAPPLVAHDMLITQQQQAGSSLGQPGQLLDNTGFAQDMRHQRGFPGVMSIPPAFQVHPSLQSRIQAFQQDLNQNGHMTQPSGFLQGFLPTDMNVTSSVPGNNRPGSSHLLQPHVRQRARRRSRANRAIQQHGHEITHPEEAGLGRSREVPPTARITVVETGLADASAEAAAEAAGHDRLQDSKLKGLEENYSSIGENFECNICFQKANEAVVTCCGHLFCWTCLYRWLHIHSYHKECPVCKGAIDESTITPIYGRECSALLSARGGMPGGSASDRIPPRPPARRVESARQLREREDRGREREQRERALERERERQSQNDVTNHSEVIGSGTALQIEEPTSVNENEIDQQIGQVTAGVGEVATPSSGGSSNLEIDQSDGRTQDDTSRFGGGTSSRTVGPPGVSNLLASHQDFLIEEAVTAGSGIGGNAQGAFMHRRMTERRDQLRAALVASARNGGNLSSMPGLTDRVDERRQMIAAALLSQEWEDIVNIGRLVGPVNPVHAAAWMAAVQGRLGSLDGSTASFETLGGDIPTHSLGEGLMLHGAIRSSRHQQHYSLSHAVPIAVGMSGAGGGDDSTLSRLVTVNPIQAGDLLTAMRYRLSTMEKIVENLESAPVQVLQQPVPNNAALFRLNSFIPAQTSSLHSESLEVEARNTSTGAISEIPSRLDDCSLNVPFPSVPLSTSIEQPSPRGMEQQAAASAQAQGLAPQPQACIGNNVTASPHSIHNSATHAEPRLHYLEAPIPKPSSSRRRASRTEDVTTSDPTNEGSSLSGQEIMHCRSKRRRLE